MNRSRVAEQTAVTTVSGWLRDGALPEIQSHTLLAGLALGTLLLESVIFAPLGLWPVAFVCLVPWLLLAGWASRAPRVYFHSYWLALAFFLVNMRWLYAATGWGYLALSLYQALYFPCMAVVIRHVVRRRRWPLAMALPLIWTGQEILRAIVGSGFPWFFLSHSLHGVLTLIQVSDLVGAYGVSFMVAAVNGAAADLCLAAVRSRRDDGGAGVFRRARSSLVFAGSLVLAVVIYGQVQLRRDTTSTGPKVAVIQGDFINSVGPGVERGVVGWLKRRLDSLYGQAVETHDNASEADKMRTYLSMMEAAGEEQPDLYLLPETPWSMILNPEVRDFFRASRHSFGRLQQHATESRALVVTGSATLVRTPHDLLAEERRYNSATVFTPDGAEPKRYDKIHLVYFGEIVPFRFGRLRPLYFWLNRLMPFSGPDHSFEYSLFPGQEFRSFTMRAPSRENRLYRFGVPICYEDVMPYVTREFVWGGSNKKRVDFLLNISNDGWFGRGIQQSQHLAICVFRAVEGRVGIARAVNTGVSGFIEPSGRIHDVVAGGQSESWPGDCGYAVANIGVDSRYTLYSRYGDWFAWLCAAMWLGLFVDYWVVRVRTRGDA